MKKSNLLTSLLTISSLLISSYATAAAKRKSTPEKTGSVLNSCAQNLESGLLKQIKSISKDKSLFVQPTSIELAESTLGQCGEYTVTYFLNFALSPKTIYRCRHSGLINTSATSLEGCDEVTDVNLDSEKGISFVEATIQKLRSSAFRQEVSINARAQAEANLSFEDKLDSPNKKLKLKSLSFDLDKNNRALRIGNSYQGELVD